MGVVFQVPFPPEPLWPNRRYRFGRGNWLAAQAAKKQYRRDVGLAALAAMGGHGDGPIRQARLSLTFYWRKGARMRDSDNCLAAFKAGIDALRGMGLIVNDSPAHLTIGAIQHRRSDNILVNSVEVVLEENT